MTRTRALKKRKPRIHSPIRFIVTDGIRHLVCLPYSLQNLHIMAAQLGLGRHWFHKDHYDIPVNRRVEIEQNALHVSPKVIARLTRGKRKPQLTLPAGTESENLDMEEIMFKRFEEQGRKKIHYCPEWDYMAIHEDSPEFDACLCDFPDVK